MMLKSSEVCFPVVFVTGINSLGGKINMTFLLKGFGEIFIERVAYLELPPHGIILPFDSPRPAMVMYATAVPV
jgi:hypothetical protein